MRFSRRLERLERGKPTLTRILVLRNDCGGTPEVVGVVGGCIYERDNFPNVEAFWEAIHADEARAWEADPQNPDPIKSLFDWVSPISTSNFAARFLERADASSWHDAGELDCIF